MSQEFEGRLEIIIGEDCSPDSTAKIVEEYQRQHPNVVKIVTSQNNVGAQANFTRVLKAAQGEFIAICDGDDYWVDTCKIQKQLTALKGSDYELCFTTAHRVSDEKKIGDIADYGDSQKIFSYEDVIKSGGGFMPTATIMVKKRVIDCLPDWFEQAPVGDYYLQILGSKNGAIYLPEVTASYRVQAVGSWSSHRKKKNLNDLLVEVERHNFSLNAIEMDSRFRKYALANEYLQISISMLLNDYYNEFSELISKSWKLKKNISKVQFVFYNLRWSKIICLMILIYIRRKNGY